MYKPIIKNFISFKPILAYKNYILVNEGDLIEDIIFVKHGVLTVELPINMTNPQENIEKYLTIPASEKDKENNKVKELSKIKSLTHQKNDTLGSFVGDKPNKAFSFVNSSTFNSSFNYKSTFMNPNTLTKEKTIKIEKVYVKILGIRENEHFGDVLMFLEERSPLRVRVRSKKCELFFLKKIDALKISTSYPNIWRRINKKSVYNFKQIKKSIRKIVEIYCCAKKVNEGNNNEDDISNDSLKEKFGLKNYWKNNKNYDLNNSALKSTQRIVSRRNKSQKSIKVNNKNIFKNKENLDESYFNINNVNNIKIKRSNSVALIKSRKFQNIITQRNHSLISPFSFSDSSSSEDISIIESQLNHKPKKKKISIDIRSKKKKLTKKLLAVFNRNYKYYKGINKNQHKNVEYPVTIIAEETDKECSINPMIINNSSVYKNSINSKSKILEDDDTNPINKKRRKSKNKRKKKKSLFGLKGIEMNNYETIKNREILVNTSSSDDNKENYIDNENIINTEIYPGELIEINNE